MRGRLMDRMVLLLMGGIRGTTRMGLAGMDRFLRGGNMTILLTAVMAAAIVHQATGRC